MNTGRGRFDLLTITFAGFFLFGFSESLLGVAWPAMRLALDQPVESLSVLLSLSMISLLFASLLSGWIINRLGTGMLMALGVLFRGIGLALYTTGFSWGAALMAAALAGWGAGWLASASNTYLTQFHSAGRVSWLHATFGIGATAGPLLIGGLAQRANGWQLVYGTTVIVAVVLLAVHVVFRHRWPAPIASGADEQGLNGQRTTPFHLLLFWMGLILFFLYRGIEVITGQWTYSLLTEARAFPVGLASITVSLFWAGLTAGRLAFGWLAEKIDVQIIILGGLIGCFLGGTLYSVQGLPLLTIGSAVVLGVAMAPVFPLLTATTPYRVGKHYTAVTVGLQIAGGSLGAAALPALVGLMSGISSLEVIGPILTMVSALLIAVYSLVMKRQSIEQSGRLGKLYE